MKNLDFQIDSSWLYWLLPHAEAPSSSVIERHTSSMNGGGRGGGGASNRSRRGGSGRCRLQRQLDAADRRVRQQQENGERLLDELYHEAHNADTLRKTLSERESQIAESNRLNASLQAALKSKEAENAALKERVGNLQAQLTAAVESKPAQNAGSIVTAFGLRGWW